MGIVEQRLLNTLIVNTSERKATSNNQEQYLDEVVPALIAKYLRKRNEEKLFRLLLR